MSGFDKPPGERIWGVPPPVVAPPVVTDELIITTNPDGSVSGVSANPPTLEPAPSPGFDMLDAELKRIKKYTDVVWAEKRERLKNVDFFLLDNSIRESTVGQLRGHTVEDKIKIYDQVRRVGITDIIVASFSNMTRVDDDFVKHLRASGEDFNMFYSFSEVSQKGVVDGEYESETLPIGLKKNLQYGIKNTIFEVDLENESLEWDKKYKLEDLQELIRKRIDYVFERIPDAKVLVNLRDFPIAMENHPKRMLKFVQFLSSLPKSRKLFAIIFEDSTGEYLPEQLEAWTTSLRRVMDYNGLRDGKILVHIHQKWDLATAAQLDCISAGADGVWTSLCEEGAAVGHACSSITMMNMIRFKNKLIQNSYRCIELRKAAIEITKITSGAPPHPKQVLYGERAMDIVFGGGMGEGGFSLADFFGVSTPNRINTLATTGMISDRLKKVFGMDPQFDDETILKEMKEQMLKDLREGRKEEYHSPAGVAILFDQSGGKLTQEMADIISMLKLKEVHHDDLIAKIRARWDEYDLHEEGEGYGDGQLEFDSFYHGFMAPYFGCYRCERTRKAMGALDMNVDGNVDWKEMLVYIKWALRQYPDTEDADVLMNIVFKDGLIPAMVDMQKRKNMQ